MNSDFAALAGLHEVNGYKILEALWIQQVSKIEEARDKAAQRGNENAWRYYAGQEKGFKLAMTALARAMTQMERDQDNLEGQSKIEKLLEEIKK